MIDIILLTYNQESYIKKTLDSILCQKCNTLFRIIVNDDVSTDSTKDILYYYKNKYPDIIDLQLNTQNLGIPNNFFDAVCRSSGDIIMQCAGDDWWIDSQKIQRQIDVLEENPSVGLIYSDYYVCDETDKIINEVKVGKLTLDSMLFQNEVAAPTVCFRRSCFYQYINEIQPQKRAWMMEDYPMWLWFFANSRVFYLQEYTSVYRCVSNSISHNTNWDRQFAYINSSNNIKKYYNDRFNIFAKSKMDNICHLNILHLFLQANDYIKYKKEAGNLSLISLKSTLYKIAALNQSFFCLLRSYVKK